MAKTYILTVTCTKKADVSIAYRYTHTVTDCETLSQAMDALFHSPELQEICFALEMWWAQEADGSISSGSHLCPANTLDHIAVRLEEIRDILNG